MFGSRLISFSAIGSSCLGIADCGWDLIPNIECRDDGSGLQCLCMSGYYGDVGTLACNIVSKYTFVFVLACEKFLEDDDRVATKACINVVTYCSS